MAAVEAEEVRIEGLVWESGRRLQPRPGPHAWWRRMAAAAAAAALAPSNFGTWLSRMAAPTCCARHRVACHCCASSSRGLQPCCTPPPCPPCGNQSTGAGAAAVQAAAAVRLPPLPQRDARLQGGCCGCWLAPWLRLPCGGFSCASCAWKAAAASCRRSPRTGTRSAAQRQAAVKPCTWCGANKPCCRPCCVGRWG